MGGGETGTGIDCGWLLIQKKCYGIIYVVDVCCGLLLPRLAYVAPLNLSVAGQTAQTQRIVHHVELIWLSYHVFYYIVIHDIRL